MKPKNTPKNAKQLSDSLAENYALLKNKTITTADARALAYSAGKLLSANVETHKYNKDKGYNKKVAFLECD